MVQMLSVTMPKIVFCETGNIHFVRAALLQIGLTIPIFTFGASVDGSSLVSDLMRKTGDEEEFM